MSVRIDLTISAERGEHGEAYQGPRGSVNSDNSNYFQLCLLSWVLAATMPCSAARQLCGLPAETRREGVCRQQTKVLLLALWHCQQNAVLVPSAQCK